MTFKSALERIAQGLLLGIGFAPAFLVFNHFYTQWQMSSFDKTLFEDTVFKEYKADAGLVIKAHRPQKAEDNDAFVGQIANEGKESWANVEIVAELFGTDGEFLDKCSSYVDGTLAPGQTRNFKVSCPNCRDNPMQPYDSYTLAVVDARFVP